MRTTISEFSAQTQGLTRIKAQHEAFDERVSEIRKSLYGTDNAGGIIQKINTIELNVKEIKTDLAEVKKVGDEFQSKVYKAILFVVTSGLLSGGASGLLSNGAGKKIVEMMGP